jgi:multidrug efflux system outer membrane protein
MRALSLMALPLLGACSLAPTYHRPASPVPPSWPVGDAYLAQSERILPEVSYSDIFRDPRLQQIISQAIANNRDLRIAAANIVRARAQYRVQRAEILPVIDASASAGYSDTGDASSNGTGTGTNGRRASFSADIGTTAFEVDLFGRIRSLSAAALNRYFASEAAARATRLTLTGDIADAWLAYAADQSLLAIAAQTVASATKSVELTRRRLEGGIAPRTDLRQAETVLATAQADLAAQRTAIAQDLNALQLLVGAPIDPALLPQSIEEAGTTLAELPAGLDSGILLRRPDVVEAEYQLRAANAEIGAARAELFPRISLTGLAGFASDALSRLFTGDAFGWQGAGTASYSIFRAGAGGANVTASKAQHDALLAAYEKSIQTAFREVADALARRGTIDDQVAANNRLVSAAEDNYRLTEARYRGGIDSFLTSLDAQRSLYTAQRSLVTVRLAKAGNLVALYRALGGDALSYTL